MHTQVAWQPFLHCALCYVVGIMFVAQQILIEKKSPLYISPGVNN